MVGNRGRRALPIVVLVLLAVPLVMGAAAAAFFALLPTVGPLLPSVLYERGPDPTDSVDTLAADRVVAAFHAKVRFADGATIWLRSGDGGVTWTKEDRPSSFSSGSSSLVCADDEVCYLPRSASGSGGSRVDRIDVDGTWRTEATFASCAVRVVVVQASDSTQALAQCGDATVAHRTTDGQWVEQDLLSLARTLR